LTGLFDNNTTVEQVIEWLKAQALTPNPFAIALVPLADVEQHLEKTRTKTVKGENGAPDTTASYVQKTYLGGTAEEKKGKNGSRVKITPVDLGVYFNDSELQLTAYVAAAVDEDTEGTESE
jgi:hypothetical protein